MAAELYPPMAYSPVWLALATAIAIGIVGWAAVIWAQTRPMREPREPPLPPGYELLRLKGRYLERIDEIVGLSRSGELSGRRAHQELSVAVREFVEEATGVSAPTMTLADLRRAGNPALLTVAEVVRELYPAEFGPDRSVSVPEAAARAREVVAGWT